jgi:hypothetical protein
MVLPWEGPPRAGQGKGLLVRRFLRTLVGVGFCLPAYAQAQDSVSITLRGYVSETSALKLVEVNPVISRDLRGPVRDALVARLIEQSNSRSGYTIVLSSENARRLQAPGLMRGASGPHIAYQARYDGKLVKFVNGRAKIERRRRTHGKPSELRLSMKGDDSLPSGAYSDVIMLSIMAR